MWIDSDCRESCDEGGKALARPSARTVISITSDAYHVPTHYTQYRQSVHLSNTHIHLKECRRSSCGSTPCSPPYSTRAVHSPVLTLQGQPMSATSEPSTCAAESQGCCRRRCCRRRRCWGGVRDDQMRGTAASAARRYQRCRHSTARPLPHRRSLLQQIAADLLRSQTRLPPAPPPPHV